MEPDTSDWPYYLALLANEEGEPTNAINYFQAMRALSPDYLAALHHLGNTLLAQRRLEQAEAAFEELLTRAPGQPWGHLGMAKLARQRERPEEAVRQLQRALEIDPTLEEASYLLGTAYSDLGRLEDASRYLEGLGGGVNRASPLDPLLDQVLAGRNDLRTLVAQADRRLSAGDLEEAESLYRKVLSVNPDRFEAILPLARVWGRQGRMSEAKSGFEKAIRLRPESTAAHLGLALTHFTLDQGELGLGELDRLLAIEPGHEQAQRMREDWESGVLLPAPVATTAETKSTNEQDLADACQQLKTGRNNYFSDFVLRQQQEKLARGGLDPNQQIFTRGLMGFQTLILGRTDEAIAILSEAWEDAQEQYIRGDMRSFVHWYLALAQLQRAEDQNCVGHRTAASCLLPITREGIHPFPEASRIAGDLLLEYAEAHPRNIQAAWLLNLARSVSGDYPDGVPEKLRLPEGAFASEQPFGHWRDVAPELAVNALDLAGGAVMDDFDGDGNLDLVTTTWDPCDGAKAYRNDGRGGFEDVSKAWKLDGQLGGLNLVHADYDNDGDLDLLILRGAWLKEEGKIRNSLLRNDLSDGRGFSDVTHSAGLAEPAYPTQTAAWADFDGDGDLDLYIGNEGKDEKDYPSQLFRNEGAGADGQVVFIDVATQAGVLNRHYTKGVVWGDYDNDGDADLYVSNNGQGNRLYRNDSGPASGQVKFTDVASRLGVTQPEPSFASWFFDYDNDGDLDLFVTDYREQTALVTASYFEVDLPGDRALLYRNDLAETGAPGFTEVSLNVGLGRPSMTMGANFGDLDNDGDQDLLHQLGGFFPADSFGNALFLNPGTQGGWVTLRLVGNRANRSAIGARIELVVGNGRTRRSIHRVVGSGGSFGGSSLQQEIGVGEGGEVRELIVQWPGSGLEQRFGPLAVNRVYRIVEGTEAPIPVDVRRIPLGE